MNTTQIIQAIKKLQVELYDNLNSEASIKVNKAFEKKYNFTSDDFFAVVNDETPFKLWNKGNAGWASCSWISLKKEAKN